MLVRDWCVSVHSLLFYMGQPGRASLRRSALRQALEETRNLGTDLGAERSRQKQ